MLFHDILQQSPLADRFWVIGGLLIGWAREGRILENDWQDADFGFLREDREKLLASIPRVIGANFNPLYCLRNNAGEPVIYVFEKDWAYFEFYEYERSPGVLRCWTFGPFGPNLTGEEVGKVEMISQVPAFGLAPMGFLGRTWQKPDRHDEFLKAVYGDWTTPNPHWDNDKDDLSIVETYPWTGSSDWPVDEMAAGQSGEQS